MFIAISLLSSDVLLAQSGSIFYQPIDSVIVAENGHLINVKPNGDNIDNYLKVASSLSRLSRIGEAKKMYLSVLGSLDSSITRTYYHNSDIYGDTATRLYGYGSFTSNYKNNACINLAEICVKENQFQEALNYLELAKKRFPVRYTCGTGAHIYSKSINRVKYRSLIGIGEVDTVLHLLMPEMFRFENADLLKQALYSKYGEKSVQKSFKTALNTIRMVGDPYPSYATIYSTDENGNSKYDTLKYTTAEGEVYMFGEWHSIGSPMLSEGHKVTLQDLKNEYLDSHLYHLVTSEYRDDGSIWPMDTNSNLKLYDKGNGEFEFKME